MTKKHFYLIGLYGLCALFLMNCHSGLNSTSSSSDSGGATETPATLITLTGTIEAPSATVSANISKQSKVLSLKTSPIKAIVEAPAENVSVTIYTLDGQTIGQITTSSDGTFSMSADFDILKGDNTETCWHSPVILVADNGIQHFADLSACDGDTSVDLGTANTDTTMAVIALIDQIPNWTGWNQDNKTSTVDTDLNCRATAFNALWNGSAITGEGLAAENGILKKIIEGFIAANGDPTQYGATDLNDLIKKIFSGEMDADTWNSLVTLVATVDTTIHVTPPDFASYTAAAAAYNALNAGLNTGLADSSDVCADMLDGTLPPAALVGPMLASDSPTNFTATFGTADGFAAHGAVLINCATNGTCDTFITNPGAVFGFMQAFGGNYTNLYNPITGLDTHHVDALRNIAGNCSGDTNTAAANCAYATQNTINVAGIDAFVMDGALDTNTMKVWTNHWREEVVLGFCATCANTVTFSDAYNTLGTVYNNPTVQTTFINCIDNVTAATGLVECYSGVTHYNDFTGFNENNPACANGANCTICGNHACEPPETAASCVIDCNPTLLTSAGNGYCGDETCQSNEATYGFCPSDCVSETPSSNSCSVATVGAAYGPNGLGGLTEVESMLIMGCLSTGGISASDCVEDLAGYNDPCADIYSETLINDCYESANLCGGGDDDSCSMGTLADFLSPSGPAGLTTMQSDSVSSCLGMLGYTPSDCYEDLAGYSNPCSYMTGDLYNCYNSVGVCGGGGGGGSGYSNGMACSTNSQCSSSSCINSTCNAGGILASMCSNNYDCSSGICSFGTCSAGGSSGYSNGHVCSVNGDCESHSCIAAMCNGGASNASMCMYNYDCSSGNCSAGMCASGSSGYSNGQICATNMQCESGNCYMGYCAASGGSTESSCTDSIDNDNDTYTDCYDTECTTNASCLATCGNSICNGWETSMSCPGDCAGGSPPYSNGHVCSINSNCTSNNCYMGYCSMAESPPYSNGHMCTMNSECSSTNCYMGYCTVSGEIMCSDGMDNDTDGYKDCTDSDCSSNWYCTGNLMCGDGTCNNSETNMNCYYDCTESNCTDTIDNDSDGQTDCADTNCSMSMSCMESNCTDGLDNEGDGQIDCADSNCSSSDNCRENYCNDTTDNDGDGPVDCADSDCTYASNCYEMSCGDSTDNDTDGFTDCDDSDCAYASYCYEMSCSNSNDDDNDGFTDCDDSDCSSAMNCYEYMCGNSADEDGDGLIDCADSDCATYPACI